MTFARVKSYATANSTTSNSTLQTFRPAATVPQGDFLIAAYSFDNISTLTGQTNNITSITDTNAPGYVWQKLGEYTYSAGAAGDGAGIALFMLYVNTATVYPSGGSFTANFSSAITAKACVVNQFTATGPSAPRLQAINFDSINAGDAPPITLSGLDNSMQFLFFRGVGSENNSNGITVTTGWTAGGATNGNTTVAATSSSCLTEFLISAATSATSDPAHGPADQAGILVAIADWPEFVPSNVSDVPPVGRFPYVRGSRDKKAAYDFTVSYSDAGINLATVFSGVANWHTDVPPKKRKPLIVTDLTQAVWPLPADIDTSSVGFGIINYRLPDRKKRLEIRGMSGWMNRDNEMSFASRHFIVPQRGRIKFSYQGTQSYTIYEDSFEFVFARSQFDVPRGKNRHIDRYLGMQAMPLSADSIEAYSRYVYDVPKGRNRNSYAGTSFQIVGPDADEVITKMVDVPMKGRDKGRFIRDGFQAFDTVQRDETGTLVAYRGSVEEIDLPQRSRNKHSYAGFTQAPALDDVAPATTGYQWDMPNPRGRTLYMNRYIGVQQRVDLDQRREDATAGFTFTDLPTLSRVKRMKSVLYEGYVFAAAPPDLIAAAGKIWRPIFRPRRR